MPKLGPIKHKQLLDTFANSASKDRMVREGLTA